MSQMKFQHEFHIFLDMDGVIADFDSHARAHGKYDDSGTPRWDELDLQWWRSIPPFDGAREFYMELRKAGAVKFLTAPVPATDCFTGKAEWVQTFLPDRARFALLDLIICHASAKAFMAAPKHILIDDRQKNIDEWVRAGGIGILHSGDYADTLARMKEAIASARQAPKAPQPPKPPVPKP